MHLQAKENPKIASKPSEAEPQAQNRPSLTPKPVDMANLKKEPLQRLFSI